MFPSKDILIELYGTENLAHQEIRYNNLIDAYKKMFGENEDLFFISAAGRTELSGNHTDHNHGKVLCAAVHLDSIAVVAPRSDSRVILSSTAFPETFELNLDELEPQEDEKESSYALIRGLAASFVRQGFKIGGFNAAVQSDVLIGSGLSSSASFEVLVGHIFNVLFNGSKIDAVTIAKAGQFAENHFFGKPCGLMDQVACAVGGVITIDFESTENPLITEVKTDFSATDYSLLVVDTGGSHADLTPAYASIPIEMKAVAALFGKENLRELDEAEILKELPRIRKKLGDRSALRTLHFYRENERVSQMIKSLQDNDIQTYLTLVDECGSSSTQILQNTIPPASDGKEQPVALALGISNDYFKKVGRGVCRIQGGGFAGTIQAYVHKDDLIEYKKLLTSFYGEESVQLITIRQKGILELK